MYSLDRVASLARQGLRVSSNMHEVDGTFCWNVDACPASSRSGPKNWFVALPSGTLVPSAAEGGTPTDLVERPEVESATTKIARRQWKRPFQVFLAWLHHG